MPPTKPSPVIGFDIISDETIGKDGFLSLRRVVLRNQRADHSYSCSYSCHFVVRDRGADAVVVALFHKSETGIQILVRRGLRPAMALGRNAPTIPVADQRPYLFFAELVAGILEFGDTGIEGIRRRASIEVWEEAGFRVSPQDIIMLGAGTFPTPGAMAEKFWLSAVEITNPELQQIPPGDGSPMEESATTQWLDLDQAIEDCVAGKIEDAKTELTLRRLRSYLG